MKNKIVLLSLLAVFTCLLFSCVAPSPLYGTWFTSEGDKIILANDGAFRSDISDGTVVETLYGTWSTNQNLLTFNVDNAGVRLSQWEIDGGVLKMTWTCDGTGTTRYLTFYRSEILTIIL